MCFPIWQKLGFASFPGPIYVKNSKAGAALNQYSQGVPEVRLPQMRKWWHIQAIYHHFIRLEYFFKRVVSSD